MNGVRLGIGTVIVLFGALLMLLAVGLNRDPTVLDLATKGQKIPAFRLPDLLTNKMLTNADLRSEDAYYLINFWGSWCPQCHDEHAFLLKLAQTNTLYGVNWKDDSRAAKRFLAKANPFRQVIVDNDSELAIGMGVYGAPETFLIAADGTIIYRYAGALNEAIWNRLFTPKINTLTAQ